MKSWKQLGICISLNALVIQLNLNQNLILIYFTKYEKNLGSAVIVFLECGNSASVYINNVCIITYACMYTNNYIREI